MTVLAVADFWQALKIERLELGVRRQLEQSGLGDGSLLTADVGPTLWTGTARLARLYHRDHDATLARLSQLEDAGAAFFAYDPTRQFPQADPDGSALGAATPTLSAANVGSSTIRVEGLPEGYVLSAGDLVGFSYGSGPTRHALHRVVNPVTAGVAGVTGLATVTPALRTGAAAGDPVALIRPAAKFVVVPGSLRWGEAAGPFLRGVSFSFVQTLR